MPAHRQSLDALTLRPLVACLLAVCGAGVVHATNLPVTSCQDSGSGSLRAVAQMAGNTDTIDLTQLQCSQITLTTGRVELPSFINVVGPGSSAVTIDGNNYDRIFFHDGGGVLYIKGLTLTHGAGGLAGGCVYSNGNVQLNDVAVRACKIIAEGGSSTYRGGGLFVSGILAMVASTIEDNEIYSSLGNAVGGGAYVVGDLSMTTSTISGNRVSSAASQGFAKGGGAYLTGGAFVDYSTIAGNSASSLYSPGGTGGGLVANTRSSISTSTISGNSAGTVGGVQLKGGNTDPVSEIVNSTISGNAATVNTIGGVLSHAALKVANSTIAFNTETLPLGAGLFQDGFPANLQSTIIANNGGASSSPDVGEGLGAVFGGANNLIKNPGTSSVPADTIEADPGLLPLADNGGRTLTHLLSPTSVAINAGNNSEGLGTDQRGASFPRVRGADTDIGAVEVDSSDAIFANGFD
ncbi:MAG: choice-of-anchor Q domain-containing protein [Dokdonella sp.]